MQKNKKSEVKNIEDLRGWRKPTGEEVNSVSRIMVLYNESTIKTAKVCSIIAAIVGTLCLFTYAHGDDISPFCAVFGLLCYIFAVAGLRAKKRCARNKEIFRSGDFLVLEGHVCELQSNDRVGRINVKFESNLYEKYQGWFAPRQEGVTMGSPLFLVWVDKSKIPHGLIWAFSPFMMTEEASKFKW